MRVTNGEQKIAKEQGERRQNSSKKAQSREEGEAEQGNGDPKTGTREGSRGGGGGAGKEGSKGAEEDGRHHRVSQTGPPVLWESCLSPVGALPSRRGQALHWLIRNTQR